jgi:predicted TIM-barrel fold metal-dependent hydrolase
MMKKNKNNHCLQLLITLCFLSFTPPSHADTTPIIDMHCHAAGIGAGNSGCYISPDLLSSYKFSFYLKSFYVTKKELEENGDGLVIQRLSEKLSTSKLVSGAIVLALDGVIDSTGKLDYSRTKVYVPNEFVLKETNKYPNLYFGASINPYRKNALELLEKYAEQGAQLIKWLPSIQYIRMNDRSIIPFYKKMVELDLPLLTHVGNEKSFSKADNALCDPVLLELPLSLGVTVIAAHVATTGENDGQANHERLIPMFKKYTNLYGDISSLTQINKKKYLSEILKHKHLQARLLYGSDMPLINTLLVSPWYFPVKLKWKKIRELGRVENIWDKDVELKRALGVPEEMFTNGYRLFPMSGADHPSSDARPRKTSP